MCEDPQRYAAPNRWHPVVAAAVERLVDLAVRQRAILISSHDPIVWKTYQKAGPDWLRRLREISDRAVKRYRSRNLGRG
ncbi:MAG: hypothetical protein JXB62_23155 [Pirellulales bacterium]|nr:hypothetical protein [Pirellulales bacterium]